MNNKKRKTRSNPKKDIEKFESLWPQILCKAILKVSSELNEIPLFHLLTGNIPVIAPMTWDGLWSKYMTHEFLHCWLLLDNLGGEEDGGSDGEGHDTRSALPWTICELN